MHLEREKPLNSVVFERLAALPHSVFASQHAVAEGTGQPCAIGVMTLETMFSDTTLKPPAVALTKTRFSFVWSRKCKTGKKRRWALLQP